MRKGSSYRRLAAVMLSTSVVMATSSCVSAEEQTIDGYVYCVDKDTGEIVDEDYCDDNGPGTYWFWTSTTYYEPGRRHYVPQKYRNTKYYINPSDPKARSQAGIPKTGKVTSGQKISSGGFGNGAKVSPGKGGGGGKGGSGGG